MRWRFKVVDLEQLRLYRESVGKDMNFYCDDIKCLSRIVSVDADTVTMEVTDKRVEYRLWGLSRKFSIFSAGIPYDGNSLN